MRWFLFIRVSVLLMRAPSLFVQPVENLGKVFLSAINVDVNLLRSSDLPECAA